MPLNEKVGGHALKIHGNYIIDHGKSWKKHGIVFSNFCGNPVDTTMSLRSLTNLNHGGLLSVCTLLYI